ncbi:hypothetical protein D3C72_1624080 [compost metagenome]
MAAMLSSRYEGLLSAPTNTPVSGANGREMAAICWALAAVAGVTGAGSVLVPATAASAGCNVVLSRTVSTSRRKGAAGLVTLPSTLTAWEMSSKSTTSSRFRPRCHVSM